MPFKTSFTIFNLSSLSFICSICIVLTLLAIVASIGKIIIRVQRPAKLEGPRTKLRYGQTLF